MLRAIVAFLLAVVVAVLAAAGYVAWNLERLVNAYRDDLGVRASTYLGRTVQFGPVNITWQNGLGAEFTQMRLAGAAEGDPQAATVDRLLLRLDVMKMVRTRGRRLEVSEAVLEGARITLRRRADGTWDFQDVVQNLAGKAQQEAEQSTKSAGEYFRELEIAGLRVKDGRVTVQDDELGQRFSVDHVDVAVSTIIPGRNVSGDVRLVLDDGKTTSPLDAHLEILPLPVDLEFTDWPTVRSHFKVAQVDLGTWGRLLPSSAIRPSQGTLSVNLEADISPDEDLAKITGGLLVDKLRMLQGDRLGAESSVGLDLHIDAGLRDPTVRVHKLDVRGPGLAITTRLEMVDRTVEGIRDARMDLEVQDLKRLLAILPEGSGVLPKELALEGPFKVAVQGDAEEGHVVVDLDRARVAWAGVLDKGAGTRLNLDVTISRRPGEIEVSPVSLQLADANIAGDFTVPVPYRGLFRGQFTTGELHLSRLRPLFPAAGKLEKDGIKLDGVLRLTAQAEPRDGQQAVQANVALQRMDVRVPRVRLTGDGALTLQDAPDRRGHRAELSGDLMSLAVDVVDADGAPLFRKRRGVPADIYVDVLQQGGEVRLRQAQVNVGGSSVVAEGLITGVGTPQVGLDLRTQQLFLDVNDVRALVPRLARLPPGTAEARVVVKGSPQLPQDLRVLVDDLEVSLGRSHVSGVVALRGTADPVLGVNLDPVALEFAELSRAFPAVPLPRQGRLQGKVSVTGRPADTRTLRIAVDGLEGNVFDVNLRGRLSVANLQAPEFDVVLEADRIQVEDLQRQVRALTGSKPAAPQPAEPAEVNPNGLGASARKQLAALKGTAALRAGRVTWDKYVFDDVDGLVTLQRGNVRVDRLTWSLYGGYFNAAGSEVRLAKELARERLILKVGGLNLGRAVDAHTNGSGRVAGYVDADVDLVAQGLQAQEMVDSLQGPISVASPELRVSGINLLGEMFSRLNAMAPVPIPVQGSMLDRDRPTAFSQFSVDGRFSARRFATTRPLQADTEFGTISFAGVVYMDSRIDLVGSARLQPQIIEDVTEGAIKPPEAVLVPVELGGTWGEPRVTGLDVAAFAKGLGVARMLGPALEAAEKARADLEERSRAAREAAERVREVAVQEAQEKANAAAQEAEERARQAAAAARLAATHPSEAARRAADEARRQALEAQRRAEEARNVAVNLLAGDALMESRRKAEEMARARLGDAQQDAQRALGAAQDVGKEALDTVNDARAQADKDAAATREQLKQNAEAARQRAKEMLDNMFQ
ncbi:MAG: AsmA family protein [Deltaproteobacteria bacterium]|nr:AsmA family protein [Deltaproteobacteria bacterium]